jgi:molybdopterin-guanine dinucleotide biosynthesis protein A
MGRPKSLLPFRGHTLVEEMVSIANRVTDTLVFVGEGPLPPVLAETFPSIPDREAGAGPLAGLVSLLHHRPERAWICLACDLPGMRLEYLQWLLDIRNQKTLAVLPSREGERIEPLAALYEPACLPLIESIWESGERSLQALRVLPGVSSPRIPESLRQCVWNVNTLQEWESFLKDSNDDRFGK